MMRKYQKGGKIYSYNKGSHYQPNTNNIYFNKEDDKSNPNAVLEHELYHRFQNENNGLQLPEYYNGPLKKPNMIMNDDYQSAYYNRRGIDEENMYNKMIAKNPDWQFISRNLLNNGYKTSSGNYVPGTDDMMYADPSTTEGEARDYENYIIKGGKTMFPNQTIDEYKSGGKWIQGAIKNPGRCTPGSPNYDCPEGSPQWRLAQTFKKHHGFHKKEDLKKYQGGGPTASDSLAVMNAQIALNKFYDNEVKKGKLKKEEDKSPITNVTFSPAALKKLNDKNLAFYRSEIRDREFFKQGPFDEEYKSNFNLNPSDVSRLEYQGLGKTKSSDANKQYYRDIITPMQNLAAPFALIDSRIKPRATVSYRPEKMGYPGGDVTVYDYDPIAVKPAAMKTAADWAYMKKTYGTKPPVKLATAPITKLFDSQQSLRNTAPDYTQMLANLKEKQAEAQYQTPPRTLPAEQPYDKSNDGQVIYYKPGQRENAQTTPFVGGQNANDYIMSKYKNGGPFISNFQKINLNLPVYKQPEMKPLQFNKFFVNDKNQNLYIGGVNPRYQNKDFSVGPYMVGVGNTNFQKLPADIGMSGTYHVNDKFDINTNIGQNNVGAGIKYKFAKGGIPNNPGFNALPKYVQKRIINNYKQGGVILNAGGEKHEIYVKTTNRGEGTKGHIMVNHPTMDKGMWDTIDLTQKAGVKTIAQGIESTKKWHKENPYMKNNKYQQGGISYNNLDDVLKRLFG